ncbi:MAG: hypothetical protein AVDCRST_MAG28-734 [uncultured Rubrobacteraceae bacterium]|uniref:Uncharacterized protein n=1 Tax=uncultured Rubrobacteraceae bacterium TaxID=349277 RepID=A0A6J4QKN7_9ACTN|nr:MAG: hypothetical protein AVDCRST_MAG28-734 [uncultured Rubrobacteraceae bacterium]
MAAPLQVGGLSFPHVLVFGGVTESLTADPEVQELDKDGEAWRKVGVTLGDVLVEAFQV